MDVKDWGARPSAERSPVAAERLERLRTKLLDLSTMNRMLSFRHPRASCLRVVDKLPEILFQSLLQGDQLVFESVEEPTRRDLEAWHAKRDQVPRASEPGELKRPDVATWARHLGLNTDYDLPVETDSFLRPDQHGDKNIQTLHYPDELEARLRKIRAAARTAIEESGANMLYMAFGFLEWSDQSTSKTHQAPLLLLPVELEREQTRGGRYRTRIRWTNEELQPNLSLRKKLEEFNIRLPELQEDQKLEAYLTDVARAVRHKSDWLIRRYVTLGLFEFGKILLYLDLDPERWPNHAPIDGHALVKTVLEGGDAEGASAGVSLRGREDVDHSPRSVELRDLQLELVDRADGSQCEALQTALDGRNLVIEGPPGTGKSQTITNLVAAALARGKTVLFVAEKLAALEVVRRRMRELGLGDFCLELHSHKTRKMDVLEDIADRVKASARSRPPRDIEGALARLAERRKKLSDYIEVISSPAGSFRDLTVGEALMRAGQARRRLGAAVKELAAAGLKFEDAGCLNGAELADAKTRLRQFAAAFEDLEITGSAYEHPWAGVSSTRVLPHDSDRIAALADAWAATAEELDIKLQQAKLPGLPTADLVGAPEALAALDELRPSAQHAEGLAIAIEQALGVSIPRSATGAEAAIGALRLAADAPVDSLSIRNAFVLTPGAAKWLCQYSERVKEIGQRRTKLREIFKEDAFSTTADDLEELSAALSQSGLFARFGKRWRAASLAWEGCARPAHLKIKAKDKAAHLASLRTLVIDHSTLQSDPTIEERLGSNGREPSFDHEGAITVAEWADRARSVLPELLSGPFTRCNRNSLQSLSRLANDESMTALMNLISARIEMGGRTTFWKSLVATFLPGSLQGRAADASDDEAWRTLMADVRSCAQAAELMLDAEKAFFSATDLDRQIWFGEEKPALAGIASRARLAAANAASLPQWLNFDRFRRTSERTVERDLVHAAAAGDLNAEQLGVSLDFLVFDALARTAFDESPILHSASGKSLDTAREEYRSLDAQVMELRRAAIATKLLQRRPPEGRQTGRVGELTDMALIRHLLAKQRPRFAIRQLVARAGRALQALKPCFMMGPLSVAQYIAPGNLQFDLVIMDEASQMRPEDAIGALARGGQAIIVGDPKQLPPTSFFDRIAERMGEDEGDEEITLAEDSKSILELASSIFDQRMLRWHYRSRHEALIAFSNRQFYKDELIVFPSPAGQADRFGIGWNFIPDGVTTKGVNPMEARTVASAAATFLVEQKNRSLGVVAMNIKQAQRITDELAAMADRDPVLAKALMEAENEASGEPFFIKNLENVQGDERDVMMISITYGPTTTAGRTPQNFGPINQETGWRRLNVLFTRAKERMEIFSSMRSLDVLPKEGGDRGPRSLKLFLEYAETGSLGVEPRPTVRDTDSDFEDAVLEGLRELNFNCVPQVGVANFYLDIGVKDPASPGEFIAAIECDGATYHSEKSARDRDRLRQEILENLGWNIIRIWSTDWFRDPNGELDRVSRELKRLISDREEVRARRAERNTGSKSQATASVKQVPQESLQQSNLFGDQFTGRSVTKRSSDGISIEQTRAKLIDLRERTIKERFPDSDPASGFLRKSMLDELLKKRPTDMDEFRNAIRLDLRQNTDAAQVKEFSERVFDILAEIDA